MRKTWASPGSSFQLRREHLDFFGEVRAGDVTIGGEFLGRRRDLLKLHGAEAPERRVDTCDLARHAHAEDAVAGEVLVGLAVSHIHVGARLQRRGFAIVERVKTVGLRHIDEHEAAAANSARRRIGDAHRQLGRQSRIDRVAAMLENLDAGMRSVVAFRHDHAMDADRGGFGRRGVRIGARSNEHRDRDCERDDQGAPICGEKLGPAWHQHQRFTNSHFQPMKGGASGSTA